MKCSRLFLLLLATTPALAQFTVAPFGASSTSGTPIGDARKNPCGTNCSFELIIKPYCFGTNLRAYPLNIQMDPTKRVTANIQFTSATGTQKKDNFQVSFPASMTYASGGSRISCQFKDGQDMTRQGNKQMACFIPWLNRSYTYTLREWLSRTNPGYQSAFNSYAGIGLPASLDPSQGDDIDKEITCLYKYTNSGRDGQMITSSVSCYFPSQLPDLSKLILVKKDGQDVSPYEVTAYTNMIRIKLKEPLNSLPTDVPVKHGKMVLDTPPKHETNFSQPGSTTNPAFFNPWRSSEESLDTTPRQIAAVKEKEGFDESNAFQSFTTQVKFAGMEGFCGGYYSPLMLFFDAKVPQFNGVSAFPLYGIPDGMAVNWPERNAPGHFLVYLKENEKKVVSYKQLFGQTNEFENGFLALKVHDDNKDGKIDANDRIFNSLYLWNDKNGDGHSQKSELKRLGEMKVESIALSYSSRDVTKFDHRATVREKGTFHFMKKGKRLQGRVFDVWLTPFE